MDRESYLKSLWEYLNRRIPAEELDGIMIYYADYFDEVGQEGEAELIRSLGSPAELAQRIVGERMAEGEPIYAPPRRSAMRTILLALGTLFLGIPLGFSLVVATLGVLAGAVACVIAGLFCGISGFTLLLSKGFATTMYFLGGGFIAIGIGLLLAGGMVAFTALCLRGVSRLLTGRARR